MRDITSATATGSNRLGGNQALALRTLARQRLAFTTVRRDVPARCQTIMITGGKGGVGRSVIALNLAIILAQQGKSVGLLDANPDLSNAELLCGLNGYWGLSHVLQNCRQLHDVVLSGPAELKILSGGDSLALVEPQNFPSASLVGQFQEFESHLDVLIVDGNSGNNHAIRTLAMAADHLLIVATPEPTAIAEAYASVKSLASTGTRLGLVVNQADTGHQSQQILDRLQQAAHSFLGTDLSRRGWIPRDPAVSVSVIERVPFVIRSPASPAATALQRISRPWLKDRSAESALGFFSKLFGPASNSQNQRGNLSRSEESAFFHQSFRKEDPVMRFKGNKVN